MGEVEEMVRRHEVQALSRALHNMSQEQGHEQELEHVIGRHR